MSARITAFALALAFAAPAFAEDVTGDAAAGEKVFAKCQTCHSVIGPAGEKLAGKGSKTGPNLYGLPGRVAGSMEGFDYGDGLKALGATGFAWNEADFVAYVADPAKFIKTKLDDKSAKAKMMFKLAKEDDAKNVYAYLASLVPPAP